MNARTPTWGSRNEPLPSRLLDGFFFIVLYSDSRAPPRLIFTVVHDGVLLALQADRKAGIGIRSGSPVVSCSAISWNR